MGLMDSIGKFFLGRKGGQRQIPRFNPEQQASFSQLLSQGMGNVDIGGLEQRARNQFEQQTVPGLAERFTSMGGGQRSSAFQGALGQAGAGLESQLAGLRHGGGMQQLQMGLTPQFDTQMTPRSPGLLQQIGGPLTNMIGSSAMPGRWGADPNSGSQLMKMLMMLLGGG